VQAKCTQKCVNLRFKFKFPTFFKCCTPQMMKNDKATIENCRRIGIQLPVPDKCKQNFNISSEDPSLFQQSEACAMHIVEYRTLIDILA
jgi:hypothetical protein